MKEPTTADAYEFFGYVAALILVVCVLIFRGCDKPEDVVKRDTPAKQEQARKSVETGRDKKNSELAVDTLRYLAANKALQREISYWKSKYKQETAKGATIEQRYRDKPTLETCDTLLQNKEERITALVGEIQVHQKDSVNKETLLKVQASHIQDRNLRIDTLSAGWEQANLELATEKQKDWGLGVQIGGTLFNGKPTPYIGAGLNYNVCRFRLKLPTSKK